MKKIFTGWIGKESMNYIGYDGVSIDSLDFSEIYRLKGHKLEWMKQDWPPIKVKVTVETIGKNIWGTNEISLSENKR